MIFYDLLWLFLLKTWKSIINNTSIIISDFLWFFTIFRFFTPPPCPVDFSRKIKFLEKNNFSEKCFSENTYFLKINFLDLCFKHPRSKILNLLEESFYLTFLYRNLTAMSISFWYLSMLFLFIYFFYFKNIVSICYMFNFIFIFL